MNGTIMIFRLIFRFLSMDFMDAPVPLSGNL